MARLVVSLALAAATVLATTVAASVARDRAMESPASLEPGVTGIPLHSFYFARARYTDDGMFPKYKDWETDFPKADQQFISVFERLASVDAYDHGVPVRLDDPAVRTLPYLYAVEVGRMALTDQEVAGLRAYLLAGGFLVVDDFWGTEEWESFAAQMARVFPDRPIVDIPQEHPLFHSYYDIDEIVQVPNVGQGTNPRLPTWELDGYSPTVRGIFDGNGRLMVAINWNTDLGDGWEWAELADYPLRYSTYAVRMGVNTIVYAMTH